MRHRHIYISLLIITIILAGVLILVGCAASTVEVKPIPTATMVSPFNTSDLVQVDELGIYDLYEYHSDTGLHCLIAYECGGANCSVSIGCK